MSEDGTLYVIRHKIKGYYHNERVSSSYDYNDTRWSTNFHPDIKWAKMYNSLKMVDKTLKNSNSYLYHDREDCEVVEIKFEVVGAVKNCLRENKKG